LESASGFKSGVDFGMAYSQSQARETESTEVVSTQELMVAADDKASLDAASLILSTTTKSIVKQIVNIKVAELATLFAYASRNVAIALASEFAIFCEKAGVDVFEVLRLLDSALGETRYSPTVGGDCTKREMQFFLENAENLDVKLRLPKLAVQVNEDVVRHAVNLTQSALRDCGKTLRRARIAVFGAAEAGESADPFVKILSAKGARINIYNPRGSRNDDSNSQIVPKRSLTDAVENCDCLVFLAAEEQFRRLNLKSLRSVMRAPAAVVDLVGWFERERVESEGFLYRGL
jgi:UDP-N-acetyl-D-mannosaminuronic acid dehydrogenase